MDQKTKIHSELRKNESYIREKFENCADILIRPMRLGSESKIDCLMVYIEVAVSNMMLDDSALGKMINHFWEISPGRYRNLCGTTVWGSQMCRNWRIWKKSCQQFLQEMQFFL